jgi:GTP-binding protein
LTSFDQDLLTWAAHRHLPVHILLNKADKLSRGATQNMVLAVRKELADYPNQVSAQAFSASSGLGLEILWAKLDEWFGRNVKEVISEIH